MEGLRYFSVRDLFLINVEQRFFDSVMVVRHLLELATIADVIG